MSSSGPTSEKWKLRRPERLRVWILEPTRHQQLSSGRPLSPEEEREARARLATAQFIMDVILRDPDFGEILDDHTRATTVPGTSVNVIWTFDRTLHAVEIITPFQA